MSTQLPVIEPTGCQCCGADTKGFTVCIDCGADMFIAGYNDPIAYCRDKNPERFEMIMAWYNSLPPND